MAPARPAFDRISIMLGVAFGIQSSRVVRGVALGIKEPIYIESAAGAICSTRG